MRALSLTTTDWRSFYETQVDALEATGVDVTTMAPPRDYRASADGVETRTPRDYVRFYLSVLNAARDDYDVVHANYGLTLPMALGQPRRPVVATLWGSEFDGHRYERLFRALANRVDEVILPSTTMAAHLERDHHVVPFPVDTERFRPIPREEARAHVDWPSDETTILFPYPRTRTVKNYPRAARVVDRLGVDATLRTVANEPYAEMPYYLNASDALLVTSRWESGPMVVKEALACGVPVVSVDVGFVAETVEGVANAHAVRGDPALVDALERTLRDGGTSDGRERIVAYDADEMGTRLRSIYEQALAG